MSPTSSGRSWGSAPLMPPRRSCSSSSSSSKGGGARASRRSRKSSPPSELASRPDPAIEALGKWVERGDEATLGRGCLRVRLRCEIEARVARQRASRPRDVEEAVTLGAIGLDRLLQRALEQRDRLVGLLVRGLQRSELVEDALAVVRNTGDALPRLARCDRAVKPGGEGSTALRATSGLLL